MESPERLNVGGQALWDSIVEDHPDLTVSQQVQLEEACRAKDRLDAFDEIIQGKGVAELLHFRRMDRSGCGHGDYPVIVEVKFDSVIGSANATANLLKQLLAALRLPDAVTGKRPQQRGGGRGAYAPKKSGTVSSLDRAREAKSS